MHFFINIILFNFLLLIFFIAFLNFIIVAEYFALKHLYHILIVLYIYCKEYYINILLKIKINCNFKRKMMQVLTIDISYICEI